MYCVCVLCPVLGHVGVGLCCTWGRTSIVSGTDLSILTSNKDRPTSTHLASLLFCALESLSLVYRSLFSVSLSQFPYMSFSLSTTVFLELSFSVSPHSVVSLGISVYLLFSSASHILCISVPLCLTPLFTFVFLAPWGSGAVMRCGICRAKSSLEEET